MSDASPSTSLCLSCGLCCDGTLFDHAPVTAEEAERLRGTRVILGTDSEKKPVLRQPCGALNGKCCTVYDSRPKTCRSFRCLVLRAVEDGSLSLDEGKARIESLKAFAQEAGLSIQNGPLLKQVVFLAWRGTRSDALERVGEMIAVDFIPDPDEEPGSDADADAAP